MCTCGLTCPHEHDTQKISLCPLFLADKCPHKDAPQLCNLSHDPTPERTPLCVRFNATGECYKGTDCLYPHVRVGPKKGICRDFAVLGYCEKGALCEASHLRECPDFAETGMCKKMGLKGAAGCKLPHVIRANHQKIGIAKAPLAQGSATATVQDFPQTPATQGPSPTLSKRKVDDDSESTAPPKRRRLSANNAETDTTVPEESGEFIPLTFLESDEEDDDEEDEEDDESEEETDDGDDVDVDASQAEDETPEADVQLAPQEDNDDDDENEVSGGLVLDPGTAMDTDDDDDSHYVVHD